MSDSYFMISVRLVFVSILLPRLFFSLSLATHSPFELNNLEAKLNDKTFDTENCRMFE